jgi:hypothetical protein
VEKPDEVGRLAYRETFAASVAAVVGDRPVRDHHALEAMPTPQQVGQQRLVEARAHRLQRFPVQSLVLEDGIGRHHPDHAGLERALEGFDVQRQLALGEHGVAAIAIMAVQALGRRAVADPMLDHGRDAVGAQSCVAALEALDIGLHQLADQVSVLAKRAVDPRPTGFGGQVCHRRQGLMDTDGAIFLARDLAEALDQGRIADRRQARGLRPLREAARGDASPGGELEVAAGIGADRRGHAQPAALGESLNGVVLLRQQGWRAAQTSDEGGDVALHDQRRGLGEVVSRAHACNAHRAAGWQGAVHHLPGLLVESHTRDEVGGALVRRQAPVFIGLQLAVAIEVAERQAVDRQGRSASGSQYGLRRRRAGRLTHADRRGGRQQQKLKLHRQNSL